LVDGAARIGKTFATRAWCERSAGLVRYVQVPASNDDGGFFRAIAQALGVSSSLKLKAAEIRGRVEETLQGGDLMLVLDEAHYLWPHLNWQRYATPARVNWVMTALVNFNVATGLICTPQFYKAQTRVEKQTGWTSEQFTGRIGHLEKLPDRLDRAELQAVAGSLLPGVDVQARKALASYAEISKKHLASIEFISRRALWIAGKDGRTVATTADVRKAMRESLPSDTALAASLSAARSAPRKSPAIARRDMRGSFATVPRRADLAADEKFSELSVTAPDSDTT
jgi:hypothetical protein